MVNSFNTSFIILLCSILTLPVSMTLSGIFLLILLIKTFSNKSKFNEYLIPVYIKKIWFLFILFSLVQGIFSLNPLFHYAGLIGHYLLYWLIFWMLSQTVITRDELKKLIITVACSGTLISLIGIFAFAGLKFDWKLLYIPLYGGEYLLNFKLGEYTLKASGFAINPNNLGCILLISTFMTLTLFELNINLVKSEKYLFSVLLFLQTSCLILTRSRGAIIACTLGLILYFLFRKGKLITLLPVIISFALIYTYNFENYNNLLTTITDLNYSSNFKRISVWKTSLEIIKDFPMGVGILNYESIYPYYLSANAKYMPHAHNWYLHTCIESGILGSLIFFTFFFSLVSNLLKNLRLNNISIVIALIIFSIFNLTDYVLTDTRVCILLTILIFTGLKLCQQDELAH